MKTRHEKIELLKGVMNGTVNPENIDPTPEQIFKRISENMYEDTQTGQTKYIESNSPYCWVGSRILNNSIIGTVNLETIKAMQHIKKA